MAKSTKKRKREEAAAADAAAGRSESLGGTIPDDVWLCSILPRLSFKSLCRFKPVCREWRDIISGDPGFALRQSLHPSPASSGVVYNGTDGLVFFPTFGSPIGVPRQSEILAVVASANGLLCCYRRSTTCMYVCNPATGRRAIIPGPGYRQNVGMGLAFDPSISPDRFKLVEARVTPSGKKHNRGRSVYRFDVFSSNTGGWMSSSQTVPTHDLCGKPRKAVFARGVLYWDCGEYLVWFDPDGDAAGHTLMPPPAGTLPYLALEIGLWEGQVTCARAHNSGLEVWVKRECGGWEFRHRLSWDRSIFADLFGNKELRMRSNEGIFRKLSLKMMPFEGGERVYMIVQRPMWDLEKMMSFDLNTGESTCFDLGGELRCANSLDGIHGYHNSMADLPNLARGCGR